MKKFKVHSIALIVSGALLATPVQAHASCCAVLAGILTSVAGVLASIDATLKLALFDPLSIDPLQPTPYGTSVARILRQTQATDAINSMKEIKANQAYSEGLRNGLVGYNQEEQQLELWRRAMEEFPDPPADICGEYALASTSADARKNLQTIQAKGSSAGLKRANKFESPGQVVADYKKVLKDKGVDYILGGTVTQPGCRPVYSKDGPTAFENKIPLPTSWDCTVAEAAPMTIPEDKIEAAQYVLNSVIDFEPIAQTQVGDRKTPAGQVYEAERAVHRAQMDIYRDFANDALSMYIANREVNDEGRKFLEGRGVKMPPEGTKISEMDYLSKQVEARWGSSKYMEQLDQMEEKNLLIAMQETQDLTNEILFKYVEMKNKQSMVDSIALSVEFNDKIKPVLQNARNKAVSP